MATYRRYKACYDFSARDDTEISMSTGHTLLVGVKPSGDWPDSEKFMKGINETTGAEGEFPGGAYVVFLEEFTEQEVLYDEPPPAPPPRRGPSAAKIPVDTEPEMRTLGPPRAAPRRRPGSVYVEEPVQSPSPEPPPTHNWVETTCQLPFPCTACEDVIWGSLNQAFKCTVCLAVCHTHCVDHVITTQQCVPTNDTSLSQHIEYAHTAGAVTEWSENYVQNWMSSIRLNDYITKFHDAGVTRGADLARVDDNMLEERVGIADEAHRQIILECLDELCTGVSSTMPSIAVYSDDTTDGRNLNRLSGMFSLHRSPSIQSIQSLLGGLGKKRGDTHVCGHDFHKHTFSTPHWCDVCGRFLWGLVMQGVKCRDCGMKVHRMCMTEGIFSCDEWRDRRGAIVSRPSFGLELSSVFESHGQKAPAVVLKCIEAVESRGLRSEGIYRVSPTKSVLISLRLALDEDPSQVDILDLNWDHNAFAGALKLYLRELPNPVFTYQLYELFVSAGRGTSVDSVHSKLLPLLDQLPAPHRSTLDTLLEHLVRVTSLESQNKMSTRNLALLFGPTLLRPPPDDIQKLIENSEIHFRVLEVLILKATPPTPPIPSRPPPRRSVPKRPEPMIPPRPPSGRPMSSVFPGGGREETDTRSTSGRDRVLPPLPVEEASESDIYMLNVPSNRPSPHDRGVPAIPSQPPSSPTAHFPLTDQGWYWAAMSKEEVASKLRDTDDGAFLVRDSSRTQGEYTLTVRKSGSNKLIRIIYSKGKYGFSEPTVFCSVPELVEFYQREPLTKYNPRLDITLSKPVSRFAKVDDDEDDEPVEDRDTTTESLLVKLQDISQIFDQKNDQYLGMEASYEECKKTVETAKNNVAAKNLWLEMIKEQQKISNEGQHIGLSRNDQQSIMNNAKLLASRIREAQKSLQQAGRNFVEINMAFRTMDKDINTIRPELMKLQWEKEQYTIQLHSLGMSKELINQRVKENAFSESESIYGTLYGTLDDQPEAEEDPWDEPTVHTFVEDPNAPSLPSRDSIRNNSFPEVPPPRENVRNSSLPGIPSSRRVPLPPQDDRPLSPPPKPAPRAAFPHKIPKLPPARPEREDRPSPSPVGPMHQRHNSVPMAPDNPHLRKETWYCEVDRVKAGEMLKTRKNGTFLCRPAAKQRLMSQGELHTHSIDIVYDGLKHLKVVTLNDKFGFSVPCTSNSLEELILRYKEHSLEQHNHGLTTTLKYPINSP